MLTQLARQSSTVPSQPEPPRAVSSFLSAAPAASRPICKALRALIKQAGPELKEVIKWNVPCYEGNGLICGCGAFKKHASLSFFCGNELQNPDGLLQLGTSENAG